MSIFEKFKKRNKKEKNKMVTIEEVKKLFEALTEADKKAFIDGLKIEKEEQGAPVPAPDKIEEKTEPPAPEIKTEEEENPAPENSPAPTDAETPVSETKTNEDAARALEEIATLKDMVAALREELVNLKRNPTPADDQKTTELDKLIARYNA